MEVLHSPFLRVNEPRQSHANFDRLTNFDRLIKEKNLTSPSHERHETLGPVPHGLSFEQSVPRSLAHRASIAEVYVADSLPAGADEFIVAIQIPRAHAVWFDRLTAYHDPLSTVEAIRQAVIVVGHRYLGLQGDAPASLQRLEFFVEDINAYKDKDVPLQGIVRLRPGREDLARDAGYLKDVSFEAELTINNIQAMTVQGSGVAFPREAYDEFRRLQQIQRSKISVDVAKPRDPLNHQLVGRRDQRNVVIGRCDNTSSADRYSLIVDQSHPFFFDHSYDHVPASLFLEAIRQTAIVAAIEPTAIGSHPITVSSMEVEFCGFAELNSTIELKAELDVDNELSDYCVVIEIFQEDRRIACSRVELCLLS